MTYLVFWVVFGDGVAVTVVPGTPEVREAVRPAEELYVRPLKLQTLILPHVYIGGDTCNTKQYMYVRQKI